MKYDEHKQQFDAKAKRFSDTLSTAEEISGLFKVQAGTMGKAASAPSVTSSASELAAALKFYSKNAAVPSVTSSVTSSANDIKAVMRHSNYVKQKSKLPSV